MGDDVGIASQLAANTVRGRIRVQEDAVTAVTCGCDTIGQHANLVANDDLIRSIGSANPGSSIARNNVVHQRDRLGDTRVLNAIFVRNNFNTIDSQADEVVLNAYVAIEGVGSAVQNNYAIKATTGDNITIERIRTAHEHIRPILDTQAVRVGSFLQSRRIRTDQRSFDGDVGSLDQVNAITIIGCDHIANRPSVADRNVLRVYDPNAVVLIALGDQARGVGSNQIALNRDTRSFSPR